MRARTLRRRWARPAEVTLYAFSYTAPVDAEAAASFVIAGAGEIRDQADLTPVGIVRAGETSPGALREKAECVIEVMSARLAGVGAEWSQATETNLYSVWPVHEIGVELVLPRLGAAGVHGLVHYHSRPPIAGIEFEMDVRSVARQVWL